MRVCKQLLLFDLEFSQEREKKEEKKKKERVTAKPSKENPKARAPSPQKTKSPSKTDDDDDVENLTDVEVRGYKTKADGSKVSMALLVLESATICAIDLLLRCCSSVDHLLQP